MYQKWSDWRHRMASDLKVSLWITLIVLCECWRQRRLVHNAMWFEQFIQLRQNHFMKRSAWIRAKPALVDPKHNSPHSTPKVRTSLSSLLTRHVTERIQSFNGSYAAVKERLWKSESLDIFLLESGCTQQPTIWLPSTISFHLSGIYEKVGVSAQFKVSSRRLTTIDIVSNTGNSMKSSRSTNSAILLLLLGQKCTRTTSTWSLILTSLQDQIECRFKWSLVWKPAFCHVEWSVVWNHPWPI